MKLKKLSTLQIQTLKTPGRYNDGGGLYLHVRQSKPSSSEEKPKLYRSWVFRYRDRITGKLRDKGLGSYPDTNIKEAREAARAHRKELRAGINPIDAARKKLIEEKLTDARLITFGDCAKQYVEAHRGEWSNEKHIAQWTSTLDTYCSVLKPLPVAEVDKNLVLQCLKPIWATKTETATRVRQRIESVLDWATASEYRTGENPARWKGNLKTLLGMPSKLKKVQHRPALSYHKIGEFMARLREVESMAAYVIELQILTATRPGETVGAQWNEINLDSEIWTIPAERMKANKEQEIPLSSQSVRLLKRIPRMNEYVFPGAGKNPHMTTAAGMKLLKEIQPGITAHGFRSTFREWAGEQTNFQRETIEHALAHQLKDKAEASYQRGTLLPKRAKLMTAWAGFCDIETTAPASVTPIRGRKAK